MRLIIGTLLIFNIHVYIYELARIYRILIKKLYTGYSTSAHLF